MQMVMHAHLRVQVRWSTIRVRRASPSGGASGANGGLKVIAARDDDVNPTAPGPQPVADALAPMVELWQGLLAQHVPDQDGRCRSCTKGGTGLATIPWPCVIHGIAEMARHSHNATKHMTDVAAGVQR
jgi:hypothetical protein